MITFERVSKKYGPVEALKEVSFRIPPGGITGLLGRNAAGKSTALNLMTGYFSPTSGTVMIGEKNMALEPAACKRMIGYLPEKPPLYDEMTVEEYLRFVCELREVLPRAISAHVAEIMTLCAVTDMRARILGHLSRGYRQRVGIAQALCGSPDILILDEPTAGLDPGQTAEIRRLIRLLGRDRTVVFSSHILSEVQQLCDRAIILKEGRFIRMVHLSEGEEEQQDVFRLRLVAAGPLSRLQPALQAIPCVLSTENISQISSQPDTQSVTMILLCRRKDESGLAEDQIFRACAALNMPIRHLSEEAETLESIFLRETE